MVLVYDKPRNTIGILQTKLRDREGHEARHGGLETMPLDQHIEGRHGERQVMYLQQTDNTRVRKSGKIAPFHSHVRGLHHGIRPNFLQPSPGLSSLAVLHAPCAVARHTSGNAPNATHTDPTTAQASQSPYTLCRPPPPTALYRRRTGDRFPSQAPWCPA